MDKLDHLNEMKKRLQALREKRVQEISPQAVNVPVIDDQLVDHLLENINKNDEKIVVEIGMQTDEPIELTDEIIVKEMTTYDKSVQTDVIEENEKNVEISIPISKPEIEANDEIIKDAIIDTTVCRTEPVLINTKDISIKNETFSLVEALFMKQSLIEHTNRNINDKFTLSHELKFRDYNGIMRFISIDYYKGFILAIIQYELTLMKNSMCYIFKFDTGEVVDILEFQSQSILKGEFIRNDESMILSVILTSYSGKIVMYELRATKYPHNQKPIVERNLISKNYHFYPVFSLWQYHSKELKCLIASTNGVICEASLLNLALCDDTNGINKIKIVPMTKSDLILSDTHKNIYNEFENHLLKLSSYDELAIMCMTTVQEDPGYLYLGCEDGGIYKVIPNKTENGIIKVSIDNNGFIPITPNNHNDEYDSNYKDIQDPVFHFGPVLGLASMKGGLMVSYGMDWLCIIWDVRNNTKLFTIELDNPVISCEWIEKNDKLFLGILIGTEFQIYEISVLFKYDIVGIAKWESGKDPLKVLSIFGDSFTTFKFVTENEKMFVVLNKGESLYIYELYI